MCGLGARNELMVPSHHEGAIGEQAETGEMEEVQGAEQPRIGLEEFPDKTLRRVPGDKEIEAVAEKERGSRSEPLQEEGEKREHRQRLVELHRMPADAVAEIDTPGERGGGA